jgi:hypothetical protein
MKEALIIIAKSIIWAELILWSRNGKWVRAMA